jgi:ABC-type uncharacterized transport system permease subunit
MNSLFSALSVGGYFIAFVLVLLPPAVLPPKRPAFYQLLFLLPLLIALLLHFWLLWQATWQDGQIRFAWSQLFSWSFWLAMLWFVWANYKTLRLDLGFLLLPLTAASVLLLQWPAAHYLVVFTPLQVHIALSIAAYSLLLLAAIQAFGIMLLDSALRKHWPWAWLRRLPPLLVMEKTLFHFVRIALLLLTLVLVSGVFFVSQWQWLLFLPKMLLALLSWLVLALLLWGRAFWGWRGQAAVYWTLSGLGLVLLTYFLGLALARWLAW